MAIEQSGLHRVSQPSVCFAGRLGVWVDQWRTVVLLSLPGRVVCANLLLGPRDTNALYQAVKKFSPLYKQAKEIYGH